MTRTAGYNRFLLLVAGLGGLLYGIDVGIIGGALPYLEATSGLNPGQLSIIVAAVLLGSVISTLFAGALADLLGRKPLMAVSGITFVASIPIIALSHGYSALFFGRLLQGISGGLIGVVVPLYLAECLDASDRGKGTAIFQWLLTLGIAAAASIGMYFSYRVEVVASAGNAAALFAFKDQAWRHIFWVSLPPGILFVIGSLFLEESPRWLALKGGKNAPPPALLRSNDPILRRRYLIPFLLACIILFCNTATGVNSIIGYNTGILLQSGLSDLGAHWGYVIFTIVNFGMTVVGMTLVDRKGRKFLLVLGTSGITISLISVAALFLQTERQKVDCREAIQSLVTPGQTLTLTFDDKEAAKLLSAQTTNGPPIASQRASLVIIYSYGGFTGVTPFVRSGETGAAPIQITRESCVPSTGVEAFFKNPFANLTAAQSAPLKIQRASISSVPSLRHGWTVAVCLYAFIGFFALGPGVCVWLALSELMPTRIRSNGMSVALVINQMVSTALAAIFLPVVGKHGYSTMFFLFAGFTVIYLITAAFFLPETKGKTLEEIEAYFEGK